MSGNTHKIKLNEIDVFYINYHCDTIRNNKLLTSLVQYWDPSLIHRVDAVIDKIKYNGVSMAQMVALMKGLYLQKPFIILEDDVTIWNLPKEIELPFVPYALYLGASAYGDKSQNDGLFTTYKNKELVTLEKHAVVEILDETLYRPLNMFGGHATLYFSSKYVKKVIKMVVESIFENIPHDIYLPYFQQHYILLGLRKSVFYQDVTVGGQEKYTKIEI